MYMSGEKIHTKRKGVWRMEYEADSKKQVVMPWRSSIQSVFSEIRNRPGRNSERMKRVNPTTNLDIFLFDFECILDNSRLNTM